MLPAWPVRTVLLLLISSSLISLHSTVSQLIVAIVGDVISADNKAGQQVLIAFVCIFIAFFASTWVSDQPFLSGGTVLTSFAHKGSSCMGCHRRKYVLHLLQWTALLTWRPSVYPT